MMLTGNVIAAVLLALITSGADEKVTFQHGRSAASNESTLFSARAPMISLPEQTSGEFPVTTGFLFVNGRYYDTTTVLHWRTREVLIENATSSMLAAHSNSERQQIAHDGSGLNDLGMPEKIALPSSMKGDVCLTLELGGIVALSDSSEPLCMDLSLGGYELLEALTQPPGPGREDLLESAIALADSTPAPEMRSWLSSFHPNNDLAQRAGDVLLKAGNIEKANIAASTAVRRFNSWSYPMTVAAMIIFVLSMGSLLTVRPHEVAAVANSEAPVSVSRFLWLIAGMSLIDLVWTLLAHQANHITEVNPVGSVMLNDPSRVILFKTLATMLAIGILYRARNNLLARKACWWTCLTLALLMARWILITGISA